MSDILVTSPYQPFTLPTQFKAVFNGYIYCGTVDAVDPSVSQVQVYLVNESGDKVPVAQPLRTNAGGFLVYNGQPAKFVTGSNHSLLVRDSLGAQIWYEPDVSKADPAALEKILGVHIMEALRRSYAEAGYSLVDGSFEDGGTLTSATDVLLQESTGKAYSGPLGFVPPGTDPTGGSFVDQSGSLLREYTAPFVGAVERAIPDRLADVITVKDAGAVVDGVTFDTDAVMAAQAAETPFAVYVPAGNMLLGTGIDTGRLSGPGNLKSYAAADNVTPPSLRKDWSAPWRTRQPFEDEFLEHLVVDGESQYYTAFASSAMINGIEVYASRIGHGHSSNFTKRSSVVLYFFDKTSSPSVSKVALYTTTVNEDVRDVNITAHPSRAGIALISFAEALSSGGYQSRLITYNVTTRAIESNRVLSGWTATDFKWGNALITPTGYLLLCSYSTDGTAIKVWRSTVALPISGVVTMTVVSTITDTVASEPTIGYWDNRIVLFYRRTGAASKLTWSYGLEGDGYWQPTVFPHGVSAHAPSMLAYSTGPVWTSFFSDGTDRTRIGSTSSNNLTAFKSQTPWRTTGEKTGGYTPIIDLGGAYALAAYSEHYDEPGQLKRTRLDRIEVDKGTVDITRADPAWTDIVELPQSMSGQAAGLMIGTAFGATNLLASNSRDYAVEFMVNYSASITGVALVCNGTANGFIELYDGATLVATSSTVALAGAVATPYLFPIAVTALTAGKKYTAKLKGDANIGLYDNRHNRRRTTVLRIGAVDIVGLLNASGVQQGAVSLVPIGVKVG